MPNLSDRELEDIFEEARASPADLPLVRLRHARRDLFRLPTAIAKIAFLSLLGFWALAFGGWVMLAPPESLGHRPLTDLIGAAIWDSVQLAAGAWAIGFALSGPLYLFRLYQARRRPRPR